METSVGGAVTVRVLDPEIPPLLAVTFAVPTATVRTNPDAFTLAIPEDELLHAALEVRS
jgi:hypothetical protein